MPSDINGYHPLGIPQATKRYPFPLVGWVGFFNKSDGLRNFVHLHGNTWKKVAVNALVLAPSKSITTMSFLSNRPVQDMSPCEQLVSELEVVWHLEPPQAERLSAAQAGGGRGGTGFIGTQAKIGLTRPGSNSRRGGLGNLLSLV